MKKVLYPVLFWSEAVSALKINRRIEVNRKFPPCIISLNEGEKNDLVYLSYQAQYKIKTQSL